MKIKSILILVVVSLISLNSFSQKDSIVNYLGRKYEKVSKEKAWYIQTIVKKKDLWKATVYFPNGKPKFDGTYKERKLKTKTGLFKKYNEKGELKSIQSYNNKGKKDGNYLYFNDNGDQITNGIYKNGKKEGVWKYFDDDKNIRARVVFKKNKVVTYKLWDEKGNVFNEELVLFKKPEFKGGRKAALNKIKKELLKDLKEDGLKTNFLVKFSVTEVGEINNVTVLPNLENKHETKIKNFFTKIKNIEPAVVANRKVSFKFSLPIILN